MNSSVFSKALIFQLVLSAIAVCTTWPLMGYETALGCAAGAFVSAIDLWVIARVVRKLSESEVRSRIFYTVVAAAKLPLLILAVYLLVVVLKFETVGLLIGFSTMVLAVLYAGFKYQQLVSSGEDH